MEEERRYRKVVQIIVADPKPILGTNEIAERFAMTQQGMRYHLEAMADKELLYSDKVGKTRVYWPTQQGLQLLDDS